MIFGSAMLTLLSLGIVVPIVLALLQKRRRVFHPFGAFFLLQKLAKTRLRALRIQQWLKLLNRILLILFIAAYFSNIQYSREVYQTEGNLFGVFVDTGRSAQIISKEGISVGRRTEEALETLLKNLPSSLRGMIFSFNDRCDSLTDLSPLRDIQNSIQLPFANAPSLMDALTACRARFRQVIGDRASTLFVISAFPESLDMGAMGQEFRLISVAPAPYTQPAVSQVSVIESEGVMHLESAIELSLKSIHLSDRVEVKSMGSFVGKREWPLQSDSWLWLHSAEGRRADFWSSSVLRRSQISKSSRLNIWAKGESRGFSSLVTALRSYPHLSLAVWIGKEMPPTHEPLLSYGESLPSWESYDRAWVFLSPMREHPAFDIRDQKTWTPDTKSTDAESAFLIDQPIGKVLIRQILIMDLKQMTTIETFQDGGPSLLVDSQGRWISPFDLEDLTTDLTLEPTFIPMLYRHLEKFLREEGQAKRDLKPLWLFESWKAPLPEVVAEQRWPGIYGSSVSSLALEPLAAPISFQALDASDQASGGALHEEWVSLRPWLLWWMVFSIFVELILCLVHSRRRLVPLIVIGLASLQSLDAQELRPMTICHASSMDSERRLALKQLVPDFSRLANLETTEPLLADEKRLASCSLVFFSATKAIQFTAKERENYRMYLERGGLFLFDDPLATEDSEFARSVKREMQLLFSGRSFEVIRKDNVIFKTYYLMTEVAGRRLASPNIEGLLFDNRWVALFSSNDLLGSQLRSSSGDYAMSVSPYGHSQRTSARRLLVNWVMYSSTLNYKDDAIHLPHILKRRTK